MSSSCDQIWIQLESRLMEKFKPRPLSHLHTADQSLREAGVKNSSGVLTATKTHKTTTQLLLLSVSSPACLSPHLSSPPGCDFCCLLTEKKTRWKVLMSFRCLMDRTKHTWNSLTLTRRRLWRGGVSWTQSEQTLCLLLADLQFDCFNVAAVNSELLHIRTGQESERIKSDRPGAPARTAFGGLEIGLLHHLKDRWRIYNLMINKF